MLTLLSPSKTQNHSGGWHSGGQHSGGRHSDSVPDLAYSQPALLSESEKLVAQLRKQSPEALRSLMNVSESLADLTYERYQQFSTPFSPDNACAALLVFKGDVYTDIAIDQYTEANFAFAQEHLRILSGLYGLLRPLDLIQPYRLEMKTRLDNERGRNLYQFWGDRITDLLNEALSPGDVLVNLASNEYFKAINRQKLHGKIITPVFKEDKSGEYRTIAIYAKRARGMMANFIIQKQIHISDKLKTFQEAGYAYSEPLSTETEWVFIR